MKKSIHPLIIVLIMIILSLFIILPPTLRAFYPKVEKTKSSVNDKITLLVCTKTSELEQLSVKSQTRYINNQITENRISFTILTNTTDQQNTERMITDQIPSLTTEFNFLKQIPNIKIIEKDQTVTLTITQDTIKQNPDNDELTTYFDKNVNTQKINYVQKLYDCEMTTN